MPLLVNRYIKLGAVVFLLAARPAQPQDSSSQQPLGDAARQQQQLHPKEKDVPTDKVYTNDDVAGDTSPVNPNSDGGKKQLSKPAGPAPRGAVSLHQGSVFDRKKDSADDFIVVPAGTQIRVNMLESSVEEPVRVRFSTPIPAATKVVLRIYGHHALSSDESFGLGDYASIRSVIIGDDTYPVRTNTIPCRVGQAIFTLTAPLRIRR